MMGIATSNDMSSRSNSYSGSIPVPTHIKSECDKGSVYANILLCLMLLATTITTVAAAPNSIARPPMSCLSSCTSYGCYDVIPRWISIQKQPQVLNQEVMEQDIQADPVQSSSVVGEDIAV
eukprot:6690320-Ditylum_brightwellii.AAC.1